MRREYARTDAIPSPPPAAVALRRVRHSDLPSIDLPRARIMLPTPPVKAVEPGRPRKERSPLGVAPAPREGLGPEGQADWVLHTLGWGLVWIALGVVRWL